MLKLAARSAQAAAASAAANDSSPPKTEVQSNPLTESGELGMVDKA